MQLVKLFLHSAVSAAAAAALAAAAAFAAADAPAAAALAAAALAAAALAAGSIGNGDLWGFLQNFAAHFVLGQLKSWLQYKIFGNHATPGTAFGFFDAS